MTTPRNGDVPRTDGERLARIERVLRGLVRRVRALDQRAAYQVHVYVNGQPAAAAAPAPVANARHSDDFRGVYWFGRDYRFTPAQAMVIQVLWEAWDRGSPDVAQAAILEGAESGRDRVDHIFRDAQGRLHPAWGVMIVRPARGFCRLEKPTA